jgi:hypothetical protein
VSGNDKKEKALNEKEELLKEALDACMEEQLSFIPPECEIVRMHTFSEEFQEYMEKLLKTKGRSKQRTMASHEFIYSFNKVAASILVLLVIGGLLAGGTMLLSRSSKSSTTDMASSSEMNESASEEVAAVPEEEYGEYEEAASGAGGSQEAPAGDAGETGGTSAQRSVEFMGGRIFLADNQRLREKTETVKTLVNSPVIARDAESIKVTIGNMDERLIYYYGAMDLEVLIDGAWYLVPPKEELTEEEDNRIVRLEPGMAQDEEIFLENYEWDYDAEQYRVVTYLDGMILCSKFRFENPEEDLEEALEQTWE